MAHIIYKLYFEYLDRRRIKLPFKLTWITRLQTIHLLHNPTEYTALHKREESNGHKSREENIFVLSAPVFLRTSIVSLPYRNDLRSLHLNTNVYSVIL